MTYTTRIRTICQCEILKKAKYHCSDGNLQKVQHEHKTICTFDCSLSRSIFFFSEFSLPFTTRFVKIISTQILCNAKKQNIFCAFCISREITRFLALLSDRRKATILRITLRHAANLHAAIKLFSF